MTNHTKTIEIKINIKLPQEKRKKQKEPREPKRVKSKRIAPQFYSG